MTKLVTPHLCFLSLTALRPARVNIRGSVSPDRLQELQASIAKDGILEPLIVRPTNETDVYEVVAGSRRFAAAQALGLESVPVVIRHVADDQVRQVQLVENAQREDLNPLEEAAAYESLLAEGLTIPDIASAVGKSPSTIAQRLKLTTLHAVVRVALTDGWLPLGHALLLARLPDATLQTEALDALTEEHALDGSSSDMVKGVLPLPVAKRLIDGQFMTILAQAPFNLDDPTLSPLGACTTCPHRSGNNPTLFTDLTDPGICTNVTDYRLKVQAHLAQLRESGSRVLTPAEVKQVFPYSTTRPTSTYVDLDQPCVTDPKERSYRDLLTVEERKATVYADVEGRVRALYPRDQLPATVQPKPLRAAPASTAKSNPKTETQRAIEQKRLEAKAVGEALTTALRKTAWTPTQWCQWFIRVITLDQGWKLASLLTRYGLKVNSQASPSDLGQLLTSLSESDQRALALDVFLQTWASPHADKPQRTLFEAVVKTLKLDLAAIRKVAITPASKGDPKSKSERGPRPTSQPTVSAP